MLLCTLTACTDEIDYPGGTPDGRMSAIKVTVSFDAEPTVRLDSRATPYDDYNDKATGGINGDKIQNINNLWLVVYDKEGNLKSRFPVYKLDGATADGELELSVKNIAYELYDNRTDEEKNDNLQDEQTGKLTFDLSIPSGSYYIYAVANVPDLNTKDISDRGKLRNLTFDWDIENMANNSQMFGIFDIRSNRNQTDDSHITVTEKTNELHAWLTRLASKVTVAFDGTQLYDNVQVFIYDISIHDIPRQCKLGDPNHPGWVQKEGIEGGLEEPKTAELAANRYKVTNGLYNTAADDLSQDIKNLYTIKIQDDLTDAQKKEIRPDLYYHICNANHPYLGKGDDATPETNLDNAHKHTARSLFFFENLQGTGKSKKQDAHKNDNKTDETPDGEIDYPKPEENNLSSGWKDHKPYGTYIEVRGFYRNSSNSQFLSSGPIVYRFMLGQDVDKDYNAKRNTHYKLTLAFKGNGNDADWHIEYNEAIGLHATSPQFISYLYNKEMNLTVKLRGSNLKDTYYLRGEIIGCDADSIKYPHGQTQYAVCKDDQLDKQTYWKPWGDNTEDYPDPTDPKNNKDPLNSSIDFFYNGNPNITINGKSTKYYGPWFGFLSMRKTKVLAMKQASSGIAFEEFYNTNHDYFNDQKRGFRNYTLKKGTYINSDGNYKVEEIGPNQRLFTIPLYTRAKELVSASGFTGNNPYTTYPRRQRIKFYIATDDKGTALDGVEPIYVDIIQVRRIVNPKGVWRSGDTKPEPFHVTLMWLKDGNEYDPKVKFEPFDSNGPWSAEIVNGGDNIITLSTTSEGSGGLASQQGVHRIEGASEHLIDFKIDFNGSKGCAIVKVRYHNYTCEHDIFCKVGYEPTKIGNADIRWQNYNVDHFDANGKAILCTSPLQEGSLFKRACNIAILPENNNMSGFQKALSTYKVKDPAQNTDKTKPDDIPVKNYTWYDIVPDYTKTNWTITNENERIAQYGDYKSIQSIYGEETNEAIKKAYGVLYGDGAKEVAETLGEAYGYSKTRDDDDVTSPCGMRGVFVYDSSTHKQIFFPIGKSGCGRRKSRTLSFRNSDPNGGLRYANRSEYYGYKADPDMGRLPYLPLFYDLYRRTGAVYWVEGFDKKDTAFDMNYHTMSFKSFTSDATIWKEQIDIPGSNPAKKMNDSDAIFIRTVVTSPSTK